MYRLVYLSAAKTLFSKAELLDLLVKAREKNHRRGLTGILLYRNGDFLQLLEGEKTVVEEIFATIRADPRHTRTTVMIAEECPARLFADWSMGFRDLTDTDLPRMSGFSPLMNSPAGLQSMKDDPDEAMQLIRYFAAQDPR
jgi:hypothetical protein